MNKTATIIMKITVVVILVASLMFGVYYYQSYMSKDNEVADLINKGNAYCDAGMYQEAIEYYEKSLEYEQQDEQIISAITYAYLELAKSQGSTDEAIENYTKALSYNDNIPEAYWAVANIYEERGETDTMMDVLRKGYEATGDAAMDSKVAGIEEERALIAQEEEEARQAEEEEERLYEERSKMLDPLKALFEAKEYDSLKDTMRQESYVEFAEEVVGDNSYYCGEFDDQGRREGKGIALYEDGYYYYGEFHEDLRSGHGILMRAVYTDTSSIGSFIFEGEWSDDKPNGEGDAISNYYKDRISANDFVTKEISGNYTDGLEDGDMTLTGTTKSGAVRTFNYKAEDGVAVQSSSEDSGIDGQYIIAQTANKDENLTSDGSVRGVEGFVEEE